MMLPHSFLRAPVAHRAYHDPTQGRIENSPAAIDAAIAAGYAIEVDVQLSRDGRAIVFHDYDLDRLTDETGPLRYRDAEALGRIGLSGGNDTIPTLSQVLAQVAGRAPLLVEIKDQDGTLGPAVGRLEQAVADELAGYSGDLAVMSFNPNSVRVFGGMAPHVPRGLVTCGFATEHWAPVPRQRLERLAEIPDFDAAGACFISHHMAELDAPPVARLKSRGVPVLCWTVRSPAQETVARQVADNITFEGYAAEIPA
ncbi:phosphodiesterase [Lutimaribacter sp. EGI FJ00015]|uniref:Phosphodiesterase n=1 Tax=Lutimaribacter degradans TaxID=2945989 RepID=A0ACC5ZWA1_9RHOB|nr:glycerophosphodiester phosphodiesterase family protein [Lutimaribacter sp. EGI FJ00013]MCM2561834.1 phosphodiesterase [Lutimaribacter sp. EGI FJ00013]MCO0613133.1 phosphodiesterase [Lutimaribacter sp. EGI FJ00015]MCO0635667.1 phosphodiesterase [Lutimaribacter sp. EGI FJ00014]